MDFILAVVFDHFVIVFFPVLHGKVLACSIDGNVFLGRKIGVSSIVRQTTTCARWNATSKQNGGCAHVVSVDTDLSSMVVARKYMRGNTHVCEAILQQQRRARRRRDFYDFALFL